MIIHDKIIQKTPEWIELRKGKMTGSKATAIGNVGKGLDTYITDIVLEELFGPSPFKINEDMDRGNRHESLARCEYELVTGNVVQEVGFVEYSPFAGVSPDGLINWVPGTLKIEGGVEIKCKNQKNHWEVLNTGKIDSGTMWQIQMNLLVTQAEWWDFISFNAEFRKSLFVKRVYPDPVKQENLLKGIEKGREMLITERKNKVYLNEFEYPKLQGTEKVLS